MRLLCDRFAVQMYFEFNFQVHDTADLIFHWLLCVIHESDVDSNTSDDEVSESDFFIFASARDYRIVEPYRYHDSVS